jgi:hypothetical protein
LNKSWYIHYQKVHLSLHNPNDHFSSANNNFGGRYNAPNHPNGGAFAALKTDGSITAWGASQYGGTSAPFGSGYTMIYSTEYAFAALKTDGSITAKADGSIKMWGDPRFGGVDTPSNGVYTKIYSTGGAFAALKAERAHLHLQSLRCPMP